MEPKVEQGTVTKAEADHLHSLEARAHGHTEKGGLTAVAQSVAAKRERQHSLSEDRSGSSNPYYNTYMSPPYNNFHGITPAENSVKDQAANPRQIEMVLRPKIEKEPEHVTKEGAAAVKCYGHHGSGDIENESPPTKTQCSADKNKTKIVVLED
jgi:hypothetical protein